MKFKWRKWFRVVHRDFGYLFFGLTIVYGISGITLNHIREWNSNYNITAYEFSIDDPESFSKESTQDEVKELLGRFAEEDLYKNHYVHQGVLRIFLHGGSAMVDLENGSGYFERSVRRPIFSEVNYLHYNPVKYWTWVSDIFSGALILLAITGLFLVRGKRGITGRGAWMTVLGIIIPLAFLFVYFYKSI